MKNILVTGAAGFIGFFTMQRLLKDGYSVVGMDNINDYYDVNLKYARLKELGFEKEDAEEWTVEISSKTTNGASFIRMNLEEDRKSTRLNSSHVRISYAVFCLKKKKKKKT